MTLGHRFPWTRGKRAKWPALWLIDRQSNFGRDSGLIGPIIEPIRYTEDDIYANDLARERERETIRGWLLDELW